MADTVRYVSLKTKLVVIIAAFFIPGCTTLPERLPYWQKRSQELTTVNYSDGINRVEAEIIGNAYACQFGPFIGHAPAIVTINDEGKRWFGYMHVGTLAGYLKSVLPPIYIIKDTGAVQWEFGPNFERIGSCKPET